MLSKYRISSVPVISLKSKDLGDQGIFNDHLKNAFSAHHLLSEQKDGPMEIITSRNLSDTEKSEPAKGVRLNILARWQRTFFSRRVSGLCRRH